MSRTLWVWELTWAVGFTHLPKHILAADIDDALTRAHVLHQSYVNAVLFGVVRIAHVQVPEAAAVEILSTPVPR